MNNSNNSNGSRKRSRGGASSSSSSSSSRGNSGNNGMKTSRPIISTTKKQKNHQSCRTVKPVTSFEKIKDAFRFYHKFGFLEPYNILFDAQFLIMATQNQVDLEEQLKRVLLRSEKFNLFCSNEVLHYLRSCPNDQHIKAVVMAKKFQRPLKKQYMTKEERRNKKKVDQQQEQNLSNDLESLKKIANDTVMEALGEGNSRKFIVALGDNHLRTLVHKKYPTTPTLRVIRETIAIDAPSQTARGVAKQKEQKVVEKHSQLTPWEREQLLKLQKPTAASDDEDTDAAKLQKQQHVQILTTDMDVVDEGDEEHESTHKPELENEDQEEQEEEEGQEEQYESESSNGSEDEDEPQTKKSKKN